MSEKLKTSDAKPVLNIRTNPPPGMVLLANSANVVPPIVPKEIPAHVVEAVRKAAEAAKDTAGAAGKNQNQ